MKHITIGVIKKKNEVHYGSCITVMSDNVFVCPRLPLGVCPFLYVHVRPSVSDPVSPMHVQPHPQGMYILSHVSIHSLPVPMSVCVSMSVSAMHGLVLDSVYACMFAYHDCVSVSVPSSCLCMCPRASLSMCICLFPSCIYFVCPVSESPPMCLSICMCPCVSVCT